MSSMCFTPGKYLQCVLSLECHKINEPHKNDKLSIPEAHMQNKPLKSMSLEKVKAKCKRQNYETLKEIQENIFMTSGCGRFFF